MRLNISKPSLKQTWLPGIVLLLTLSSLPMEAYATSGAISQSYQTNSTNITPGSLVSLVPASSNSVTPAFSSDAANLVGIAAEKPVLELSKGSGSSVQVVVNGSAMALVSNANGPVLAGDKITSSPISGVGMKATTSTEIVGTAQKALSAVKTVSEIVVGSNGKQTKIQVGLLPIAVTVVYYADEPPGGTISSYIPPFLQTIANAVTGKDVSPIRVLIGSLLVLLGFATVASMLYIGIHSHIISIGRNPLAQTALRRGLVDVLFIGLCILVFVMVVTYAILLT